MPFLVIQPRGCVVEACIGPGIVGGETLEMGFHAKTSLVVNGMIHLGYGYTYAGARAP